MRNADSIQFEVSSKNQINKNIGKKRLTINLIANLFTHGVSMLVSFLLTPYLVNHLGKEIYGFYGLANNVVNYITIVSVALNSMAAKYITVELVRGQEVKAKQYYSSIFFSNFAFTVLLTPFLTVIVCNIQNIFVVSHVYLRDVKILFSLVFTAMLLRFITSVFGTATYASNRIDLRAYSDLVKSILKVVLFISLFAIVKPSIIYVGLVLFILEFYNAFVQLYLARRLTPTLVIKRYYFNIKLVWSTLRIGFWNSLNQLGDLLLSSSDLIIGNIMLGEVAGGNLSIIKTMPTLISGVITAINAVFMPRIATRYGQGNKNALVAEVNMSQRIMGVFITSIVMLIILFGKEFFNLWVPGNDSQLLMELSALEVSRMMIIGVVWPVSNLNIVMDKIKIPSILVIVSGILNIASMYFLISFTGLGIYVIPLTTLILSGFFYGVFIPLYASKLMGLKWNTYMTPVLEMIISAILIWCIVIPIKSMLVINSWFHFFLYGGICGLISLALCLLVYIKPKNILSIIYQLNK